MSDETDFSDIEYAKAIIQQMLRDGVPAYALTAKCEELCKTDSRFMTGTAKYGIGIQMDSIFSVKH